MINGKHILAVIPARGGSKGIKNKNIINLAGKPLIAYSIEAALLSRYIDSTVVTTDSREIAATAKIFGARVPFLRPEELASDNSKTIDAVVHTVHSLRESGEEYELLVLLQPTQPLRTAEDIDAALELMEKNNWDDIVGVCKQEHSPLLIRELVQDGELKNILDQGSSVRRQDMKAYYYVNGAIYINRVCDISGSLGFNDNKHPFIMNERHSVDIDETEDLKTAEQYILEAKL